MTRAFIVVDVQRDFCEGGSLPVTGGAATAARISQHLVASAGTYDLVVATRDWHVDPGRHFVTEGSEPGFSETWPVHCVAGTEGADWHPRLHLPDEAVVVSKGERKAAFSGFEGTTSTGEDLLTLLRRRGVDAVDVAGIATSYCVRATALDAVTSGCATRVLAGLTADVDPAVTPQTLRELEAAGVEVL